MWLAAERTIVLYSNYQDFSNSLNMVLYFQHKTQFSQTPFHGHPGHPVTLATRLRPWIAPEVAREHLDRPKLATFD